MYLTYYYIIKLYYHTILIIQLHVFCYYTVAAVLFYIHLYKLIRLVFKITEASNYTSNYSSSSDN